MSDVIFCGKYSTGRWRNFHIDGNADKEKYLTLTGSSTCNTFLFYVLALSLLRVNGNYFGLPF